MLRSKRLVLRFSRPISILCLGLVCTSLTACAGYTFTPNGSYAGLNETWGGSGSSQFQPRQQAQQYNCESRPVYGAFGEFLRTDTVCR